MTVSGLFSSSDEKRIFSSLSSFINNIFLSPNQRLRQCGSGERSSAFRDLPSLSSLVGLLLILVYG